MTNYQKAVLYYRMHIYTKDMLKKLVEKSFISAAEYKQITGETYAE
ncbi:MAG: XkdX family protein [Solobacterium sp.]|jgi:hypothetical protein|nr:XkdX family protein [Solobacterium sp.]